MTIIAASVLDADFAQLRAEVEAVDAAGVDMFTLDIMDGHFAPRITFGEYVVGQIRSWTSRPIEVHMMITNPENWVSRYIDVGADLVVFHVEATTAIAPTIDAVKSRGRAVGLALLAHTPVEEVLPFVPDIDIVNFLAVPVGFGGQKSAPDTFDRVARLRDVAIARNPNLVIEVDGGVKPNNAHDYVSAGANMLTVGTGIYHSSSYVDAVAQLHACTSNGRFSAQSTVFLQRLKSLMVPKEATNAALQNAARAVGARD